LSESLGLQAGDVIVAINGFDISGCKHKEAQEKIVSAGNSFQLTIQR
jgi:type II secretory pathway component PulC